MGLLAAAGAWMAMSAGRTWDRSWLVSAVTARGFLIHAAIVLAGAAAVVVLLVALAKAARRRARRPAGESGVAILEFALVLPWVLFLVLMMAQSALLMVGHMSVSYAAFCAARSAVVYVPANREAESNEPPNELDDDPDYSTKMAAIKEAAVWALLPVSSGHRALPSGDYGTVADGLEGLFAQYQMDAPRWMIDLVGRKIGYARDYTTITLEPPENGLEYDQAEDLHVLVQHTFYLSIPYASAVYARLAPAGVELSFGTQDYHQWGMEISASCRLTNEGVRDTVEMDEFPVDE